MLEDAPDERPATRDKAQLAEEPFDAAQRGIGPTQQHPGRQHEMNALPDANRHGVLVGADAEALHIFAGCLHSALADMLLQADRGPLFGPFANVSCPKEFNASASEITIDGPSVVHHNPEDRQGGRPSVSGPYSSHDIKTHWSAIPRIVALAERPIGQAQWTGYLLDFMKCFTTPPGPGGGCASRARQDRDARAL